MRNVSNSASSANRSTDTGPGLLTAACCCCNSRTCSDAHQPVIVAASRRTILEASRARVRMNIRRFLSKGCGLAIVVVVGSTRSAGVHLQVQTADERDEKDQH